MGKVYIDRTGERYGKLIIIQFSHHDKRGNAYWLCSCDCGRTKIIRGSDIGIRTNSCGMCCRRGRGGYLKHQIKVT